MEHPRRRHRKRWQTTLITGAAAIVTALAIAASVTVAATGPETAAAPEEVGQQAAPTPTQNLAVRNSTDGQQLHQIAVFDGFLLQRSLLSPDSCPRSECWSKWYDRADAVPPGAGRITGVSYFTIDGVLHEWVAKTYNQSSHIHMRMDGGEWLQASVPGDGPITSITSTVNNSGKVHQYYWRSTSRDPNEQQAYERVVEANEDGVLPGQDGGGFQFVSMRSDLRDTVFDDMRKFLDVDEIPDLWLHGPVVSHTLFVDETLDAVRQGIWIDSARGSHGFHRWLDRNADGTADFTSCGLPKKRTCEWLGAVTDWELGLGEVTGQTFYYGPIVVTDDGPPPVNGHVVRLEWLTTKKSFCSGTMISVQLVLTAAHCVYKEKNDGHQRISPDEFQIRLAKTPPGDVELTYGAAEIGFPTIRDRPVWEEQVPASDESVEIGYRHDLAVIRLRSPIPSDIRPARPRFVEPQFGDALAANGWKGLSEAGSDPSAFAATRVDCRNNPGNRFDHHCVKINDGNDPSTTLQGQSGMAWRRAESNHVIGVHHGPVAWKAGELPYPTHTKAYQPIGEYGDFLTTTALTRVVADNENRQRVMTEVAVPTTAGNGAPLVCSPLPGQSVPAGVPPIAHVVVTLELLSTTNDEAEILSIQLGNLGDDEFFVPWNEFATGIPTEGLTLPANGEVTISMDDPDTKEVVETRKLFRGERVGWLDYLELQHRDPNDIEEPCEYHLSAAIGYHMLGFAEINREPLPGPKIVDKLSDSNRPSLLIEEDTQPPAPDPGSDGPALGDLEGKVVKIRGNERGEPTLFVRNGTLLHIGTADDYWDCIGLSGHSGPVMIDNDHVVARGWPVDWSGTTDRCSTDAPPPTSPPDTTPPAPDPAPAPGPGGPDLASLHNSIVKIRGDARGEPALLAWEGKLYHIGTAEDYWDCHAQGGGRVTFVDDAYVQAQGWPIDWSGTTDRCS
ncbi:MAG: trypsin-like serine protease [Actinomycetota bacterium]